MTFQENGSANIVCEYLQWVLDDIQGDGLPPTGAIGLSRMLPLLVVGDLPSIRG
jgi:hypothetical protein